MIPETRNEAFLALARLLDSPPGFSLVDYRPAGSDYEAQRLMRADLARHTAEVLRAKAALAEFACLPWHPDLMAFIVGLLADTHGGNLIFEQRLDRIFAVYVPKNYGPAERAPYLAEVLTLYVGMARLALPYLLEVPSYLTPPEPRPRRGRPPKASG